MSANLELAALRMISDRNILQINMLHETLEKMIDNYSLECDYGLTMEQFRQAEFALQELWGFTQDARYHTWCNKITQKHMHLMYTGRTFLCNDTNTKVVLKGPFYHGSLYQVGDGFIDVGVAYHRLVGNITEVKMSGETK